MYISRSAGDKLIKMSGTFPVVVVTGARQVGKSTLLEHLFKGKADIRDYFKRYPGRFELVHIKDSYESDSMQSFACVGSGIIDFPELLSSRKEGGFKHLIVEHDNPGPENEMECARSSINYLNSINF